MPGSAFDYAHLLPHRLSPASMMVEPPTEKFCRACSAPFLTKARTKKRCDPCQAAVDLRSQARANLKALLKRRADRGGRPSRMVRLPGKRYCDPDTDWEFPQDPEESAD